MKRTKLIWVAVLAWLLGLGLATQFYTNYSLWLWAVLLAGVCICAIYVKSKIGYIVFFILFLCAGLLRGQMHIAAQDSFGVRDLIGKKVELTGVVQAGSHWNDDKLYEFYIGDVRWDNHHFSELVKVKTLSGQFTEGQTVQVRGKLGRALGRASAQVWYADVETLSTIPPLPVRIKRTMQNGLTQALSPVSASFASGLLFGGSSQLPGSLQEATRQAGLTHIVAVSGFNLTIITALVLTFFGGRLRLKTVLPILGLIVFFVVMTGATSSVLRAAVMSSFVLLVGSQNRRLSASTALAVTMLTMTAWSPAYLYWDLSWQLSVLALAGVIFLAPLFTPHSPKRYRIIWEIFAVSLGAHLATAPLIAHTFGSFSVIAPLANSIVLPLIPLAMLFSFLASVVGVFSWGPTGIIASFSDWFLQLILQIIQMLARLPYASVKVFLGLIAMWVSFVGLGIFMLLGARRASKKALQQV